MAPRGPGGSPGTLRLILGDQLNLQHSWFGAVDPRVSYLLMEVRQETDYVRHHIQKVLAFFQAMRAFRDQLQARGHRVLYLALDDPANRPSISENLDRLLRQEGFGRFEYQLPDEYRVDRQLREFCAALSLPSRAVDSEHFLEHGLRDFGRFQDAMSSQHPVLFHSRLCEGRRADIHQVEGFVRQILGWREYLRGVYWERMPEYAGCNYFQHRRSLPGWYWSGRTRMNCLAQAIGQSLEGAYAHHIQRLMVTGAFALMAGHSEHPHVPEPAGESASIEPPVLSKQGLTPYYDGPHRLVQARGAVDRLYMCIVGNKAPDLPRAAVTQ